MRLQVAHTWQLDAENRAAARELLDNAFEDMRDEDWEHCLGGLHALVWDGTVLVAHGAVVQRHLIHSDRALRTGYVEGVAVRADRRRRGHGTRVMEALHEVIRNAYEIGALGSSEMGEPFYEALGWRRWRGRTFGLTPQGIIRTAGDDDGIYLVDGTASAPESGDLICDWRAGDLW